MMSCASCEQAIPPAEAGLPCPRCGSVDRNVTMADYGAVVDEVTGSVSAWRAGEGALCLIWCRRREPGLQAKTPGSRSAPTLL
jgi:hypothetical protein